MQASGMRGCERFVVARLCLPMRSFQPRSHTPLSSGCSSESVGLFFKIASTQSNLELLLVSLSLDVWALGASGC